MLIYYLFVFQYHLLVVFLPDTQLNAKYHLLIYALLSSNVNFCMLYVLYVDVIYTL